MTDDGLSVRYCTVSVSFFQFQKKKRNLATGNLCNTSSSLFYVIFFFKYRGVETSLSDGENHTTAYGIFRPQGIQMSKFSYVQRYVWYVDFFGSDSKADVRVLVPGIQ